MQKLSELKRNELLINGIYKITNIANNKFYIGSCSSKTYLYERLKHHQQDLINNNHCNIYLQKSYNKYGIENFYYEIIEECLPEKCIIKEQYWIDLLNPHYNLLKKAGSSFGRVVSQETANKISNSNKKFWSIPENKELMIEKFRNRKRIAPYKKGYKNSKYTFSEKGINAIKEKKSKKVINNDTGEIYNSLKEASNKLSSHESYLSKLLNGKINFTRKKKSKYNIQWI